MKIYLSALESSRTCRSLISSTPSPNAITRLKEEDEESTCRLSMAGDMVMMLVEGILGGNYGVQAEKGGIVDEARYTVCPILSTLRFDTRVYG